MKTLIAPRLVLSIMAAALVVAVTLARAAERHVAILVYHSVAPHEPGETADVRAYKVSPQAFEAQMQYLRDREFRVVPLAALVADLKGGPAVPSRAVVITFDDGWVTQYRYARPILQRFGYTATFFIFPNPIGRDARFMTWDELHELRAAGMSIGSHSRTHPKMTLLNARALQDEVTGSRRTLEARLGAPVEFFAYPFGEHPPAVEAAVRAAGYLAAREFPGGSLNRPEDLWALRSVMVTDNLADFRRHGEP